MFSKLIYEEFWKKIQRFRASEDISNSRSDYLSTRQKYVVSVCLLLLERGFQGRCQYFFQTLFQDVTDLYEGPIA